MYGSLADFAGNSGDLLDYMFDQGQYSWQGFQGSTGGFDASAGADWMGWSGWSGTTNGSGVIETTVNQTTYLFDEAYIPSGTLSNGDTVSPAIVIPISSMNNDTEQIDLIAYDYTSNGGSYNTTASNSGVRSQLITFAGSSVFPAGDYRVYFNDALSSNTNYTNNYYFKGSTLV